MNILERYARSRWDIAEFSRLLGVEPHPGQVRFYEALLQRDETQVRAQWLTLCVASGNRAGKTLMLAVAILHHTMHKIGLAMPAPDDDEGLAKWVAKPYHWYHFGIVQEVAELVWTNCMELLNGNHYAQKEGGCPLVDAVGQIAETDKKERGEYRWIVFDGRWGGGEVHFRTTSERALGSLGKEVNGESMDEAAFEPKLHFVVNEVLHMRRMGTGGPLLLISTPSDAEDLIPFSEQWTKGDPENPERNLRRFSMRMSTRDNLGYGLDQSTFDAMISDTPDDLIPQNIDGYFIEGRKAFFNHSAIDAAFRDDQPVLTPRQKGHHYIHGIDPAVERDATTSIVCDVVEDHLYGVSMRRKKGKQNIEDLLAWLIADHYAYEGEGADCATGCDTTGMGGKIFKSGLSVIPNLRAVEFGGVRNRKVKMLVDLKTLFDQGKFHFPRDGDWLHLRKTLLGYRLEDRYLDTDDVMSLAVLARVYLSYVPGGVAAVDTDIMGYDDFAEPLTEDREKYRDNGHFIDAAFAGRTGVVTSRMAR